MSKPEWRQHDHAAWSLNGFPFGHPFQFEVVIQGGVTRLYVNDEGEFAMIAVRRNSPSAAEELRRLGDELYAVLDKAKGGGK